MGNLCIRDLDHLFSSIEHTSYHFTHNLDALWTAVMGPQTLADLVAGIFTGVTKALASVKSGLEAAWDGIKSAGQFIGKAVLDAIYRGYTEVFSLITMIQVSSVIYNKPVTLETTSSTIKAKRGDQSLVLDIFYSDMSILLNGTKIFSFNYNQYDTLGVDYVLGAKWAALTSLYILASLATAIFGIKVDPTKGTFLLSAWYFITLVAVILADVYVFQNSNNETSEKFIDLIEYQFDLLLAGAILSKYLDGKKFTAASLGAIGAKGVSDALDFGSNLGELLIFGGEVDIGQHLIDIIYKPLIAILSLALTNYLETSIGQKGTLNPNLTLLMVYIGVLKVILPVVARFFREAK